MKYLLKSGWSKVSGCFLVATMLPAAMVKAETGFFFEPSIMISEIHDDNIFFSLTDEESAEITRVSPEIEAGYESQRLVWDGRYRFDAEDYRGYSELNSDTVRRLGDMAVEYLATRRLTLSADVDYTKTKNPVDISLVPGTETPGVVVGRVSAERLSMHPSVHYRFSKRVSGRLSYRDTRDKISGGVENNVRSTGAEIGRKLTSETTANLGYTYSEYRYENAPGQSGSGIILEYSHRPWIGISHEMSPNFGIDGRAGSIRSGGSEDPYLLLTLRGQYSSGQMSVHYERNETTSLGDATTNEYQTVYAAFSKRFGRNLNIEIAPGYTKLDRNDSSSKIYHMALQGWHRISDAIYLNASYDLNYQEIDFDSGAEDEVKRNVIQLGITFIYPRDSRVKGSP